MIDVAFMYVERPVRVGYILITVYAMATHPLSAISISFLTPECSKMSCCRASASNATLNVKDLVEKPVSI